MSLGWTDGSSSKDMQQEMLLHSLPAGSADQDEVSRTDLHTILLGMTALKTEMDIFNVHIVTQDSRGRPLSMWPKYEQFSCLDAAYDCLQVNVKRVEALAQPTSMSKCCVKIYVAQARKISIKVSNTIASVMETMSNKMKDFDIEAEADPHDTVDQDATISALMAELAEIIKHLTEAAEITWAAMNLLESIAPKPLTKQKSTLTKLQSYIPWACCAFVTLLACIAVYSGQSTRDAPHLSHLYGKTASILEMQSVCSLVNGNLDVAAQFRNATLAEFDQRFQALDKALMNTNERIDNVWDALGPPNAQGTYFMRDTISGKGTVPDGRASNLGGNLQERVDKLEANALELKKKFQRSEVRMTTRLNKLDRKRGG